MSGATLAGVQERPVGLLRRSSLHFATVGALVGVALAAVIAFAVFGVGDYREPERPIDAAGIGATFVVGSSAFPDAEVTVLSGTRSVYRTTATITLAVRYRALEPGIPDSFGWGAYAGARRLAGPHWSIVGLLTEGETIETELTVYGPAAETIRITYQHPFDDGPRYELLVRP